MSIIFGQNVASHTLRVSCKLSLSSLVSYRQDKTVPDLEMLACVLACVTNSHAVGTTWLINDWTTPSLKYDTTDFVEI